MELQQDPRFFVTSYSHCCYGGRRVKWTTLLHNSPELHAALHKPDCPGHPDLESYTVEWEGDHLSFATAEEAEYPWEWCKKYAGALKREFKKKMVTPLGNAARDFNNMIYSQIRGATRGLQDETYVMKVVVSVRQILETMNADEEQQHLRWLMRHVGLRGTDVRLSVEGHEASKRESQTPHPAFRWLWKTVLSYRWGSSQHINILEASAILAEFRRRVRSPEMLGKRFFNIVDSMVMFFAMAKGRSPSKRLNRILRRIMAVSVFTRTIPVTLWTLLKWNYADLPSRRFDPKKQCRDE
eukprot:Skav210164  [mRNA]  locus=scaffold5301:42844:43734:- [translate_table: standard]